MFVFVVNFPVTPYVRCQCGSTWLLVHDSDDRVNLAHRYFLLGAGFIYDLIVEPPSMGKVVDAHGNLRPQAFMTVICAVSRI